MQFARLPQYIVYDYETAYTGTASEDAVPRIMHVRMSVPSLNFTYLPKIESKVVSVDSKVVSIDEAVTFYASSRITPHNPDTPDDYKPDTPDIHDDTQDTETQGSTGSSGGGCNSGLGIFALLLVFMISFPSFSVSIKALDEALPISHDRHLMQMYLPKS